MQRSRVVLLIAAATVAAILAGGGIGLALRGHQAQASAQGGASAPATTTTPAEPASPTAATAPTPTTGPVPVTAQDLLSAPVPASCHHAAGQLVNGVLPSLPTNGGEMGLAWMINARDPAESAGTAFGDLTGGASDDASAGPADDAAAVLYCDAGGVPWPEIIAFYGPGPKLLAWSYVTAFNLPGIQPQENATVRAVSYRDGAIYAEWSTQDNGDAAAEDTLDYSATLKLVNGKITATSLVGVTERQTVLTFASDLRAGNQAAADALAAPGVGAQAASLFRTYPSALAATPTCYGLGDQFTMPTSLANLIDEGGPDQVGQGTERLCAFPSTSPGASYVALGMQRTGWRTWRVQWAETA